MVIAVALLAAAEWAEELSRRCGEVTLPIQIRKVEPNPVRGPLELGLANVVVAVVIDQRGAVTETFVASPRDSQIDEEAIRAIRKWRFKPATCDAVPVAVRAIVSVNSMNPSVDSEADRMERARGHYNLGVRLLNGDGIPRNTDAALRTFRTAGRLGFPDSYHALAVMHMHGRSVPVNLPEAARLARVGADAGSTHAQLLLAEFLEKGVGISKDPAEALGWAMLAVRLGHAPAQANVDRLTMQLGPNAAQEAREWAAKWKPTKP
ncbi:MAG: TonB family protein [Bryobacteraceae bacterium]|nr:TonB family protein [Bryobacteraceae bacterium]